MIDLSWEGVERMKPAPIWNTPADFEEAGYEAYGICLDCDGILVKENEICECHAPTDRTEEN